LPSLPDRDALYYAIGILGATVMPHNLYLHSALVQSRKVVKTANGIHQSLKYNTIDSVVALNIAFFINAAILVMAAAVFYRSGHTGIASIQDAHALLAPLVGSGLAPVLFAVALICAGQSSTITGTLAGQIVMEGFVNIRRWLRSRWPARRLRGSCWSSARCSSRCSCRSRSSPSSTW
ncbi:MAG: natural resistance-associated macrophage protein metal ion transporter, partial [Deltaproteobacteria bacterium]|nr:natural resistance-associated macrophage protein metal ion transporter [Deltaproteobacteria bacterium]